MMLGKGNPREEALPFTTSPPSEADLIPHQEEEPKPKQQGTEGGSSSPFQGRESVITRKPSLLQKALRLHSSHDKPLLVSRLLFPPPGRNNNNAPSVASSSLRRAFSFQQRARRGSSSTSTKTEASGGGDSVSDWEGDTVGEGGGGESQGDDEKDGEERHDEAEITNNNPPPPPAAAAGDDGGTTGTGTGGNLTTIGGRKIPSCLQHSNSDKSKKSPNKVTFSLGPDHDGGSTTATATTTATSSSRSSSSNSSQRSSSSASSAREERRGRAGGKKAEDGEGEEEDHEIHTDDDNGGNINNGQSREDDENKKNKGTATVITTKKKTKKSKTSLFITAIARPLRSPLLLVSPTGSTTRMKQCPCHHHRSPKDAKPVHIFLEGLAFSSGKDDPDSPFARRASYPHALVFDLNDLVPPPPSSPASPSSSDPPPTPTTTKRPSSSSPASPSPLATPLTPLQVLDLAARQTACYADEVRWTAYKHPRHVHNYHPPLRCVNPSPTASTIGDDHDNSNNNNNNSDDDDNDDDQDQDEKEKDPLRPPVPWNEARLADIARTWLTPGQGWQVVFRCEAMPWLGWFGLHPLPASPPAEDDDDDGNNNKKNKKNIGPLSNQFSLDWWDKCLAWEEKEQADAEAAKKKKTKTKKSGGKQKDSKQQEDDENDRNDDDDDDDDDNWVCFSRNKRGVMRIDLVAKMVPCAPGRPTTT